MNAEGALLAPRCTVCGQLALDTGELNRTIVHAGLDESSVVCNACSSRLSAEISQGHTVVIGDNPESAAPQLDVAAHETAPQVPAAPAEKAPAYEDLLASRIDSRQIDIQDAEFEFAKKRSFGSYELLGEISRGSFGVVYKARQAGLDRIVALKVLLDGAHASKESVERFHREAKSVARLKHPNVVPIYDIGTWDGHHYFAMEFIEGHPLSAHILARNLTISAALSIAASVADALESAHRSGVIHRDIKPSNILIDKHGTPHITDFGLAKQVDLDNKYTMSGTTLGTPAYMPPEQARGQLEKIDSRSDVYALGTVLYEMLTGVTPFTGRSLLEVVVAVINEPVPPPRQVNPKIHRDVQTIVLKCLEKEPKNRYASAADLRDDLRRFRSGEAILAKPASVFNRLGRFFVRRAWYFAATAGILIAAGLLAYVALLGKHKDEVIDELKREQARKAKELANEQEEKWKPEWEFSGSKSLEPGRVVAYALAPSSSASAPETRAVPPGETQVTPQDKRFFGDFRSQLDFTLTPEAAAQGFNVGVQSVTTSIEGIPYSAEFGNGTVRLLGPADLYVYERMESADRNKLPKLEVKLQKEIPPLVAANYTLNIERNDMHLTFTLAGEMPPSGPQNSGGEKWGPVTFQVRDYNLSHWTLRYTQFVLRRKPSGMLVTNVMVKRKLGGKAGTEVTALNNFLTGEYSGAELDFNLLAKDDDGYTRARAKFFLGLIKEICVLPQPGFTIQDAIDKYGEARRELDALPPPPSTNPELARERRELDHELRLRLAVAYSKNRNIAPADRWNAIYEQLYHGWRNGEKLNESLGWELQNVLKDIHREPCMDPQSGDKITEAILLVFSHAGLSPFSERYSDSARDLGRILVLKNSGPDLRALYRYVPTVKLNKTFAEAAAVALHATPPQLDEALALLTFLPADAARKEPLLAERAADCVTPLAKAQRYSDALALLLRYNVPRGFVLLCNELGPNSLDPAPSNALFDNVVSKIATIIPPDNAAQAAFEAAAVRLGRGLLDHGRDEELIALHNALRLGAKQDPRLAALFVESIKRLAGSADPADETLALRLLKHAYLHVSHTSKPIQEAAQKIAEAKSTTEDEEAYTRLLVEIKQACPSADLSKFLRGVYEAMNQTGRYDDALAFFSRSRALFAKVNPNEKVDEPGVQLPQVVTALEGTLPEGRTAALEALSASVRDDLKKRGDDDALHQWALDDGDLRLALGQWENAVKNYQTLLSAQDEDPVAAARAALRLRVLAMLHPDVATDGVDAAMLSPFAPDDIRLAAELLNPNGKLTFEAADKKLKQIHVPILADVDWPLLKGLRRRQEGKAVEAQAFFREAVERAQGTRPWTYALAVELTRPVERADP